MTARTETAMRVPMFRLRVAALADRLVRNIVPCLAGVVLVLLVGAPVGMVVMGSLRGHFDYLLFEPNKYWTLNEYIDVFTRWKFLASFTAYHTLHADNRATIP